MNLHWIDWLIIGLLLAFLIGVAVRTHMLTRSVADFLAGNRCAGRYLLTMADGMAGLGAISIAANFEKFYEAGFAGAWWEQVLAPLGLILALSGFVIYRYRETRALTMAQFFEMRYSRRFRVFAGMLAFLSGVLNYGIFPAVTARFLVYFCGLPVRMEVLGFSFPTIAPVMFLLLAVALTLTLSGGQIAVMITDFFQGQMVQITILICFFVLISQISWTELIEGLKMAPEQASRLNPFEQEDTKGFNPAFFVMIGILNVYGFKAWQGSQGYNAAPKSPHEARMANILGMFRAQVLFLLSMLCPLFVFAMLHLPQFSGQAETVNAVLATIENPQIQEQMRVPAGLSELLPIGVMGLFVAMIISAAVSTDDTYLHSWGSIFIQDVVMPLRKKPLSPKAHMWLLRGAIVGVAAFAFCFSLLFPLNEYIYMYFQITGAIYLGGAGAVILGGLYWKRGSVEGAWAAMIIGSAVAVCGIVLRNIIWPYLLPDWKLAHPAQGWLQGLPEAFPLDGVQMSLIAALSAATAYVAGSLLSKRPPVNMDKLLHRGQYAVEQAGHHPAGSAEQPGTLAVPRPASWRKRAYLLLGISADFTRGDRFIYLFATCFALFWFACFLVGTLIATTTGISEESWIHWWGFKVAVTILIALVATVWFLIGGIRDLGDFVHHLKAVKRDVNDDGSVRGDEHLQESD
ncbi:sodium:solute symporter [Ruficoccus amylovorans]|uniref:Sodium:solute symporter n=1 Tax=Ruficoccus amylovorans TaxID=1804625 RepID=A0A842HBA1_9BACT|nr:sodium:solute symporter [Ruficoccus amylovorans]MBC2592907.1 sodium:solute symporter [Ruficoccus amylovorans]